MRPCYCPECQKTVTPRRRGWTGIEYLAIMVLGILTCGCGFLLLPVFALGAARLVCPTCRGSLTNPPA